VQPRDGARHLLRIRRLVDQGRSPRTSLLLGPSPRRAAWPLGVIRTEQDAISGFVMADMRTWYRPFESFLSAEQRRLSYPGATWALALRAAASLARLIADIHREDYVLGDLKADNLWLDEAGRVGVSDVDSFQFTEGGDFFRCHVRTAGYTAPETIDSPEPAADEYGDRFALAVLLYQTLLGGVHPFFGVPVDRPFTSIDDNVTHGRALISDPGLIRVPPATASGDQLPVPLAELFRRSFGDEGLREPRSRPSAAQWYQALCTAGAPGALRRCSAPQRHWYPAQARYCPWCELCEQGADYFPGPAQRPADAGRAPGAAVRRPVSDVAVEVVP
jgi:DNA-binding helix-hairpin-helix protein with protein kinase domain